MLVHTDLEAGSIAGIAGFGREIAAVNLGWVWEQESPTYGAYGNPNQWTVGGGIGSLAREAAQNSNDARLPDQIAELRFTFVPLEGRARERFEEALGWHVLRRHLRAMADGDQVVTAGIRAGLEHLEQSEQLVLLRIEDRWCRGLTGPEFADVPELEYGNFIKLCRLDLFSGKEAAAGGSFGLGKAVYWRFSQLQTVLFNSRLSEPWQDDRHNRLFGVNQGTVHTLDGIRHKHRGYFGTHGEDGYVRSEFVDDEVARALHVERPTEAPGTTALIVGFSDPDRPESTVAEYARSLEAGIEEAFWPLITRGGMRFTVDVEGEATPPVEVRPERTVTELVHALRVYDAREPNGLLEGLGDVVVRDLKIAVPKRRTEPHHEGFDHMARLVVTLSDDNQDTLENKVCLVRGPEMVVETIEEEFPGVTYHAFLLAGRAVDPGSDDQHLILADEFLRNAEPPSHDRWIPRSGASQSTLSAHYVAPYLPNLRAIRDDIKRELRGLFGVVISGDDHPPRVIARYLQLLGGVAPEGRVTKPHLRVDSARVVDGRWTVQMTAEMRNRPQGWRFRPIASFAGIDSGEPVGWLPGSLAPLDGCVIEDGFVVVAGRPSGRNLRATFRAETDPATHPIPADRSALDVAVRNAGVAAREAHP